MKIAGWRWWWRFFFLLAVIVVGTAASFVSGGGAITNEEHNAAVTPVRATHRKMKENGIRGRDHKADVSLDDYRPVDPSPSSKAVRPGPIQHGTPLNPYIPKPAPPPAPCCHPKSNDDYDP